MIIRRWALRLCHLEATRVWRGGWLSRSSVWLSTSSLTLGPHARCATPAFSSSLPSGCKLNSCFWEVPSVSFSLAQFCFAFAIQLGFYLCCDLSSCRFLSNCGLWDFLAYSTKFICCETY